MNRPDALLLGLAAFCFGLYLMIRLLARLVAGVLPGRYSAYRQLAARHRGRSESRGLVDPPTVSFQHGDAQVRVGLAPIVAGQSNLPRTRVVVRFARGLPMRLELYPRRRSAPPQTPRGTREVQTEIPEFDRLYTVHANDPDIARELVAPNFVLASLEQLRQLSPPAGLLLSINPERLLIQVDRNLGSNFPALDAVTRTALALHDHLQTSVARRLAEGINVLPPDQTDPNPATTTPDCPICGDPIKGPHVTCDSCRTPTHAECWKYAGGCPTYGCKQKLASPVRTSTTP